MEYNFSYDSYKKTVPSLPEPFGFKFLKPKERVLALVRCQKKKKKLTKQIAWKYMKKYKVIQKAWDIVKGQAKNAAIYAAILYFIIPNSPSMSTIMIFTFIIPMIKGMFDLNKMFAPLDGQAVDLTLQKICCILISLTFSGLGVWKFISE